MLPRGTQQSRPFGKNQPKIRIIILPKSDGEKWSRKIYFETPPYRILPRITNSVSQNYLLPA